MRECVPPTQLVGLASWAGTHPAVHAVPVLGQSEWERERGKAAARKGEYNWQIYFAQTSR